MLTNLHKGIFLLLIFFFGTSCNKTKDNQSQNTQNTPYDILLNRALLNGYYFQQNENLGICFSNSMVYLLSDDKNVLGKGFVLFHFIKKDNTFENRDFKASNYTLNDTLFNKFKNLHVVQAPLEYDNYLRIRIGQYIRLEDGRAQNIWVKEIDVERIRNKNSFYKNEFQSQINKNILNETFEIGLQLGTFFKNSNGVYILFESDFIYLMVNKTDNFEDKFMLHFIDETNTFINKSFFLKDKEIQNFLEPPYSNMRIARIPLPEEPFVKIRIGQYNDEGNIWVQEFILEDILENPLLKYNNEFQIYEP